MARSTLDPAELARFRGYLRVLAETELDRRTAAKVDPSDIVQETLLRAVRTLGQFRGSSDRTLAAWLRRILATRLANTFRDLGCAKRDYRLERTLEGALAESSGHLEALCLATDGGHVEELERAETFTKVSEAILALPQAQARAIVLKYLKGWTVADIARELGRSDVAVAGLLRRGLAALRGALDHLR